MSIMEDDPPFTTPLESEPTLKFYAGLDVRTSGCVILQADDKAKYCVFAPSLLLNSLSSFFRDLPSPSGTDLVCGIPLIPLTDVTTDGLVVYILAVQSISQPNPFHFTYPPHIGFHSNAEGVIDAAAMSKRYDTPILFRLLVEAVRNSSEFGFHSCNKHFMEFAIWAIGGVESQLPASATASLETSITRVSSSLLTSLAHHAPHHFIKLQALHLRHHEGPCNFDQRYQICTCEPCYATQGDAHDHAVFDLFAAARTTEEIWAIDKNDFGLECEDCIEKTRENYRRDLDRLRRFTTEYNFDETKS